MIHLPTPLHEGAIRYFLARGVNVYVDKPVTTSFASTQALYTLAEKNGVLLTAGFNRRFVSFIRELATVPDPGTIQVVKNEVRLNQQPRDVLYDLVIHPIDTALFVAGFPKISAPDFDWAIDQQGALTHGYIRFSTERTLVCAGGDLMAGADAELATVTAPTGTKTVRNLTQLQTEQGSAQTLRETPKWQNAGDNRGFGPLVQAFVTAVATHGDNPVSPTSSLLTHELTEQFVRRIDAAPQ